LTDRVIPRRLGPKRASKIRKLFNLTKEDDVRKYVVRREIPAKKEGRKPNTKAPKIQRLVTPVRLQRKRRRQAEIKRRMAKSKAEAADYAKLLAKRNREKRVATASRKARASARLSAKISAKGGEPAQKKARSSDKEARKSVDKKERKSDKDAKKGVKKVAPKKEAAKGAKKVAPQKGAAKPAQKAVKKPVAASKAAPKKEGAKAAPKKK